MPVLGLLLLAPSELLPWRCQPFLTARPRLDSASQNFLTSHRLFEAFSGLLELRQFYFCPPFLNDWSLGYLICRMGFEEREEALKARLVVWHSLFLPICAFSPLFHTF